MSKYTKKEKAEYWLPILEHALACVNVQIVLNPSAEKYEELKICKDHYSSKIALAINAINN